MINGFDVTSEGFNFLLMSTEDQIKFYILNYIRFIYYNYEYDIFLNLISFLCYIDHFKEAEPFSFQTTFPYCTYI